MRFAEVSDRFSCFGGEAALHVTYHEGGGHRRAPGDSPMALTVRRKPLRDGHSTLVIERGGQARTRAEHAISDARALLGDVSDALTRFEPASDLCALNADPRTVVPVSTLVARFVDSAIWAAWRSRGLVDAALLDELENSGYETSMPPSPRLGVRAVRAGPRAPARARARSPWPAIICDRRRGTVGRPRGIRLDSGGIAKGMAADMVAERLSDQPPFAVDCAGDIRIGGTAGFPRRVVIEDPFDGGVLTALEIRAGGVATSGTLRRCWTSPNGNRAHHLIDPAIGRCAYTGVVQVTAIAPSALEAEVRAKAALLAGPQAARRWLHDGGVVVLESGEYTVYGNGDRVDARLR